MERFTRHKYIEDPNTCQFMNCNQVKIPLNNEWNPIKPSSSDQLEISEDEKHTTSTINMSRKNRSWLINLEE